MTPSKTQSISPQVAAQGPLSKSHGRLDPHEDGMAQRRTEGPKEGTSCAMKLSSLTSPWATKYSANAAIIGSCLTPTFAKAHTVLAIAYKSQGWGDEVGTDSGLAPTIFFLAKRKGSDQLTVCTTHWMFLEKFDGAQTVGQVVGGWQMMVGERFLTTLSDAAHLLPALYLSMILHSTSSQTQSSMSTTLNNPLTPPSQLSAQLIDCRALPDPPRPSTTLHAPATTLANTTCVIHVPPSTPFSAQHWAGPPRGADNAARALQLYRGPALVHQRDKSQRKDQGLAGFHFRGGGGGVDRALRPDPPPKRAQLTGPSKTDPGTSVVPMTVVFVFKDTRPPVNSGYTCV